MGDGETEGLSEQSDLHRDVGLSFLTSAPCVARMV